MLDNEMMGRRREILKRSISQLLAKNNASGLNDQENNFLQHMIKELHRSDHERNAGRKPS